MAQLQGMGGGGGGSRPNPYVDPQIPVLPPAFDPNAFLAQVLSEQEAQAQAQQAYKPQLDYLSQLEASTRTNAADSQRNIGTLYDKVAQEIAGQQGGIQKNFDTAIGGVNSAYQDALSQMMSRYGQSQNEMNEQLSRLGIMAAQPNTQSKSNQQRDFLAGVVNANQQAHTNALTQQKAGALEFNTKQGNITRQTGANAQTAVGKQLMDFLTQLGGKRADIMSTISKTASDFRNESARRASDDAKFAWQQATDARDFEYRMGKDAADYELAAQRAADSGKSVKDPLGDVSLLANRLYSNPQAAQNAIKAIQDAMNASGGAAKSADELMTLVRNRLTKANGKVGDATQLRQLIDSMFSNKIYTERRDPFGY